MSIGVVIPFAPGREENLAAVLTCLARQRFRDGDRSLPQESRIVVVVDGGVQPEIGGLAVDVVCLAKHQPGMEQPRNAGVRVLRDLEPDVTHVWFLDSDVIVGHDALQELEHALCSGPKDRIVVAPYDWLPAGWRPAQDELAYLPPVFHELRNDPRWAMFSASPPEKVYRSDLSAGLACFSGNLLWPVEQFERVGGFWNEIHHGRCEDGELGLRAVAMDVGISFAAAARGWHLWHPVNTELAIARNDRDVPMLNARHPWVERGAVFMVDRDGKAFDCLCPCGEQVPTIGWWAHAASCPAATMSLPVG